MAKIAAQTMNNYLMFNKLLKCKTPPTSLSLDVLGHPASLYMSGCVGIPTSLCMDVLGRERRERKGEGQHTNSRPFNASIDCCISLSIVQVSL